MMKRVASARTERPPVKSSWNRTRATGSTRQKVGMAPEATPRRMAGVDWAARKRVLSRYCPATHRADAREAEAEQREGGGFG